MKKERLICDLFVAIIFINSIVGFILPESSIGKVLLFCAIFLALFKYFFVLIHYKLPPYFRGLHYLLLMFIIYGTILLFSDDKLVIRNTEDEITKYNYLKYILSSLLPFFFFYYYAKKGIITERYLKIVFYLFFITSIISFLNNELTHLREFGEESTNNAGYLFLSLLPLTCFFKKWNILYVFVCLFFILVSQKRGAIMIGAICVIPLLNNQYMNGIHRNKFLKLLGFVLILTVISLYTYNYYKNSDLMQVRVEQTMEGNMSSRDKIADELISYYNNESSLINRLVGNGANSTLLIAGNYAHSDWIEILINQGVVGVVIYLLFWILAFLTWRKMRRCNGQSFTFGMVLFINLMTSIFSMSYDCYTIPVSMLISYCIADWERKSSATNLIRLS